MIMKRIPMAAAAALLATSLGATIALAQNNSRPTPQQAPMPKEGMMGQDGKDHGAMMDTAQMNRMMENCNRMMESKQHPPSGPQSAKPDNG